LADTIDGTSELEDISTTPTRARPTIRNPADNRVNIFDLALMDEVELLGMFEIAFSISVSEMV
jgi:hypothetical protein